MRRENVSHGKDAAWKSFAQNDDIRPDIFVIDGQAFAGSGQTCLDFVRNPQHVVLGAELAHALRKHKRPFSSICKKRQFQPCSSIVANGVVYLTLIQKLSSRSLSDGSDCWIRLTLSWHQLNDKIKIVLYRQISFIRNEDSSFPLNWFHHEGTHVRVL